MASKEKELETERKYIFRTELREQLRRASSRPEKIFRIIRTASKRFSRRLTSTSDASELTSKQSRSWK